MSNCVIGWTMVSIFVIGMLSPFVCMSWQYDRCLGLLKLLACLLALGIIVTWAAIGFLLIESCK